MKIDDCDVPERAILAWRRLLKDADEKMLTDCVAHYNNFLPGFRPGKVPGQAVRSKLIALLEQKGSIPEPLSYALKRIGITHSIISVFSEEVIKEIADGLSEYYGDLAYCAMLLDDRDDIRLKGFMRLSREDDESKESTCEDSSPLENRRLSHNRTAAAQAITWKLAPFIRDFTEIITDAESGDSPGGVNEVSTTVSHHAKDLNEKLAKLESEVKRAKSHAERLQDDIQAKDAELQKIKRSRDKAKGELSAVAQTLTALEAEFESRVTSEIFKRTNERLRPWLSVLIEQEQAMVSLTKSALLKEVSEVVKHQAEIDRHYGTVLKLEENLADLQIAREKLLSILNQSMRPRREIPGLLNRVELEINHLNDLLGHKERPALSAIAMQLSREIRSAASIEMMPALRTQVMKATDTGTLSITESKSLLDLIFERSDQLYCVSNLTSGLTWSHSSLIALPNNHLRALMSNQQKCRLIVDGHNVLFRLEDLFGEFYEAGHPASAARSVLSGRLAGLIAEFSSVLVDVWFDSPELNHETLHENLRVHFSGGRGANRADNAIVSFLMAIKVEELATTFVVTDDRDLQDRCRDVGAKTLACNEIASLL